MRAMRPSSSECSVKCPRRSTTPSGRRSCCIAQRELAGDIDGVLKTLTADCVDQTGQAVRWRLNNMFPWDPDQRKFSGETLYFFRPESDYFVSG